MLRNRYGDVYVFVIVKSVIEYYTMENRYLKEREEGRREEVLKAAYKQKLQSEEI